MRRMFADVEADIYLMVDGDDTYDAASAPALVARLRKGPSISSTEPASRRSRDAYRTGHRFGNWLLTTLVTRYSARPRMICCRATRPCHADS